MISNFVIIHHGRIIHQAFMLFEWDRIHLNSLYPQLTEFLSEILLLTDPQLALLVEFLSEIFAGARSPLHCFVEFSEILLLGPHNPKDY